MRSWADGSCQQCAMGPRFLFPPCRAFPRSPTKRPPGAPRRPVRSCAGKCSLHRSHCPWPFDRMDSAKNRQSSGRASMRRWPHRAAQGAAYPGPAAPGGCTVLEDDVPRSAAGIAARHSEFSNEVRSFHRPATGSVAVRWFRSAAVRSSLEGVPHATRGEPRHGSAVGLVVRGPVQPFSASRQPFYAGIKKSGPRKNLVNS